MKVYSNAFVHKETGDILGYDLAVKRHADSSVEAFLYIYEGAPNKDGIPLYGRILGNHISVQGQWVAHSTEMPSRREVVQTSLVKIDGLLDSASFKGEVTIQGSGPEQVRLRHVNRIWLCP